MKTFSQQIFSVKHKYLQPVSIIMTLIQWS